MAQALEMGVGPFFLGPPLRFPASEFRGLSAFFYTMDEERSVSYRHHRFFGGTTFVAALLVEDDDGIVFGLGF